MSALTEAAELVSAAQEDILDAWGGRGPVESTRPEPECLLDALSKLSAALRCLRQAGEVTS